MKRWIIGLLPVWLLVGTLAAFPGCRGEEEQTAEMLVARKITRTDDLIGGPSAKGKLGDYLIANDKVRFIVAGHGQAWAGGVFGGSLLDADLQRKRSDVRYGEGWDSFAETFPLVNLMVANPGMPGSDLGMGENGLDLVPIPSSIEVLEDGSQGRAVIRVQGRVGYMFETFKFLNKDFLRSFLGGPMELLPGLPPLPIDELLNMFLGVNVYSLLGRLQTDFYFYNDYILQSGESFLTIRTTILTAPPSASAMVGCPEVKTCALQCAHGFALKEYSYDIPGQGTPTPGKRMCPECQCAAAPVEMSTLNESEDIFNIFLGNLEPWRDDFWKGGLLGGDFLFFGSEANIFAPGIGFDENRKIFENMWQGVPTLASPLMFDWITAVSENVSYGWVTTNPRRVSGPECPTHKIELAVVPEELEEEVIDVLMSQLQIGKDEAESRVRQVIVDRRTYGLVEFPTGKVDATKYDSWKSGKLSSIQVSDVVAAAGESGGTLLSDLFPEGVELQVVPGTVCQDSRLLIPLFSSSATAVMTHKSVATLSEAGDGAPVDDNRLFTFERYLVVGEGDVGSVLQTVYDLKGVETGRVKGVVMSQGTGAPVSKASVFAILDPRSKDPSLPRPKSYEELVSLNRRVFGHAGLMSEMKTDQGLDAVAKGEFGGPLTPGAYFLASFSSGRGVSDLVDVKVEAGKTAVAHLMIPVSGKVMYRVVDQGGQRIPARASFVAKGPDGESLEWQGTSLIELGGSLYDHAIYYAEHSHTGTGTVTLPAGLYDIYFSRGFEYSIDHRENFEVKAGHTVTLDAVLVREVDTSGYISADLHIHNRESIDSALPADLRVAASVAEGVEFFVSTDHDHLMDYSPYVNEMELEPFVKTEVGVETTTFEFGHFNGFPMEYRDTDIPVHNPPPWFGYSMDRVWEMMRDRVKKGFTRDEFIIQANHPNDGFMGYFSQMGLKGYDLQRDTGAMEMCNPQSVFIPCSFDAMEIFNEKRFELFHTPTVAEKDRHNRCFEAILRSKVSAVFPVDEADPSGSICGDLQLAPYPQCSTIENDVKAQAAAGTLTGLELAELYSIRDHCRWHKQFREAMARCTEDVSLVTRKRIALEALKLVTVRYQLERTPAEQRAYLATTREGDVGCDAEKAMAGCVPNIEVKNDVETVKAGCGKECFCTACVCAETAMPECCTEVAQGGTGWTQACADFCRDGCHGCGVQPCSSKDYSLQLWFAFLNAGLNVTATGNSDSHDTKAEIGLPRNFVKSSTDDPFRIDSREIFRNVKAGKLYMSTGPIVDFHIEGASLGETVSVKGKSTMKMALKVQTASWFGVDHIEVYRNGLLEHIFRMDPKPGDIVDFDRVIEVPVPDEDSWFVVVTYGLDDQYLLSPVYKRKPYGVMLIPTIIAMGGQAILVSFQDVLNEVKQALGDEMVDGLLGGLLSTSELPDSFPMFPLAATNPVRVDVDGNGFWPVSALDEDGDGKPDLPPFCSRPCDVELDLSDPENPVPGQSICGLNQICVPDAEGGAKGRCGIPIPDNCPAAQVKVD